MLLYEKQSDRDNQKRIALRLRDKWGFTYCDDMSSDLHSGYDVVLRRMPHGRWETQHDKIYIEIKSRSKRFGSLLVGIEKLRKLRALEEKNFNAAIFVVEWGGVIEWCRPNDWIWHNGFPANLRVEKFTTQNVRDENDVDRLCVWVPMHLMHPETEIPRWPT